jgi:hypothetical protein
VAHACRDERWDFGDFSTAHSNGTNKVIDTQGTFCYSFPCLPGSNPPPPPGSRLLALFQLRAVQLSNLPFFSRVISLGSTLAKVYQNKRL